MSIGLLSTRILLDDEDGQLGAKVRTVSFAEKRNSRDPLCFPMTTASVLLNQICADCLAIMTDSVR